MERKTLIVILGLLSIYFSWNIHQYPPVHVDEPWETITAYQLYFHGKLNNPVLQGPEFYQEHFVEPRILQSIVLGLFYKVFGLHLWVGRMVSVILGACVLLCFYYLLKRYQVDNYLIFFGVIILSTHHYFFIFSRTIRPEIYVTFIGFACFSALLKGFDTEKKIWFALTGFLMGIGMWTHPAFAIWCAALISMLFLEYQLKTFTLKKTSIVLLFFVIGLLPFIIYLIIEDAGNDFSHFWLQIRRGAVQNASFLTQTFFDEFSRYQEYASGTRLPIVILEIVFIILSFKSNDRLSRYSRVVILFHIILLPVLIKSRKARYLVPALPLLIILMLQTFRSFELEYLKNWFRKFAALHFIQRLLIVSGIFLLVFQVSAQSILMTLKATDYEAFVTEIRRDIPSGAKVWGSMMFWFSFSDCEYRTQYTSFQEVMDFNPEYLITHDALMWKRKTEKWEPLTKEIEKLSRDRYEIISEINNKVYGDVKVWRRRDSMVSRR